MVAGGHQVDITNPLNTETWDSLATAPGSTTFAGTLVAGQGGGQQLEQLGFLHISLQQPLGLNFGSAVKLLP